MVMTSENNMNGSISNRDASSRINGKPKPLNRADEADELLTTVKDLIIPFIRAADVDSSTKATGHGEQRPGGGPRTTLIEHHPPQKLSQLLSQTTQFPTNPGSEGQGREGALALINDLLHYSVNTWDQGFLDKLYASTTPIGLASELLLSALNTNVHVYAVSPALTVVEKRVGKALANVFGLKGGFAGAVSQPGGSAANQSSIVIARNCLFPETKKEGNGSRKFVVFTSAHGHYSVEKAAQMFGLGSDAVKAVPVDEKGRMRVDELSAAIVRSREQGETPFYVNATAGTTVLGSVDPLLEIAEVCKREKLWMHVDGSWGGSMAFSPTQKEKLKGIELADSIAVCPHKMLGVPVTCSFLVGKDLREFHKGMTLPAGYLFHDADVAVDTPAEKNGVDASASSSLTETDEDHHHTNKDDAYWDLADLTPQCGRRGDSLKLALSWIYYGSAGLAAYVDQGFEMSAYLASLVAQHPRLTLVSENPPPCLQVCFYYDKVSVVAGQEGRKEAEQRNSRLTEAVAKGLVPRGFMVDYAPGDEGKFLRVVVNGQTRRETMDGLVKAVEEVGKGLRI